MLTVQGRVHRDRLMGCFVHGARAGGEERGAGLQEVIPGNARLSEHPQHPLKAWHKAA